MFVESGLAEVASVGGVGQVVGVVEFVGFDDHVLGADQVGQLDGVVELRLGEAVTLAGDGGDVLGAEDIDGDFQDQRRIDACGKGDRDPLERADDVLHFLELSIEAVWLHERFSGFPRIPRC